MLPDRVSNPGPLTYESGALPIALRGPASKKCHTYICVKFYQNQFTIKRHIHETVFSKKASVTLPLDLK